ncbi:uncharacterized protein LOC134739365 [Pongo pygmaeus]|uniref:uncharacterized protein LOC134739365 n=1 Tax=Pongo pygmaeus TaxID=9600 RepID=UPI00300C5C29
MRLSANSDPVQALSLREASMQEDIALQEDITQWANIFYDTFRRPETFPGVITVCTHVCGVQLYVGGLLMKSPRDRHCSVSCFQSSKDARIPQGMAGTLKGRRGESLVGRPQPADTGGFYPAATGPPTALQSTWCWGSTHTDTTSGALRPTHADPTSGALRLPCTDPASASGALRPTRTDPASGDLRPTRTDPESGDLRPTRTDPALASGALRPTRADPASGALGCRTRRCCCRAPGSGDTGTLQAGLSRAPHQCVLQHQREWAWAGGEGVTTKGTCPSLLLYPWGSHFPWLREVASPS